MEVTTRRTETKQRRKGRDTRRRVLQATKDLMAEKDYRSITLEAVADLVGVSKTSVLWHFGTRKDLLIEAVLELLDDMENTITTRISTSATRDKRIDQMFTEVAAFFSAEPEIKGIVLSVIFDKDAPDSIRVRVRQHLRNDTRRIVEFLSDDGKSISDTAADAIIALVHGCYIQWYLDGCPDDLYERLKNSYRALPIE